MTREEPTSLPLPSPHPRCPQPHLYAPLSEDGTNASPSLLATGDPNGATRRGRKTGKKNFGKFSGLPSRAKSTQRGPPPSQPTMSLRHPPIQSLGLLGPWCSGAARHHAGTSSRHVGATRRAASVSCTAANDSAAAAPSPWSKARI